MLKRTSILLSVVFMVMTICATGFSAPDMDKSKIPVVAAKDMDRSAGVRFTRCKLNLYWDNFHDSEGEDTCFQVYDDICGSVRAAGHNIVEKDVEITGAELAGFDVLIIVDPEVEFSADELSAIQTWIDAGHGLFLIAEWSGANDVDSINNLLNPYGIQHVDDSEDNIIIDFIPHPIVEDINFLILNLAGELDGGTEVGFTDLGELVLTVYESGDDRVAVIADSDTFKDENLNIYDEEAFFHKTIEWLGNCEDFIPAKTETPTSTPTPTFTPTPTPTCFEGTPGVDFELCGGLNLISIPDLDPCLNTSADLLAEICTGKADSVWLFQCDSRSFRSWTIFDTEPGWDLWTGMPFWVNIANPGGCTWRTYGAEDTSINYTVCTGLNMVALPIYSTSIDTASDMLADIPNCTGIFRWRRVISCFSPGSFDGFFDISIPAEDFALIPGHGFYASVTSDGMWVPPNP